MNSFFNNPSINFLINAIAIGVSAIGVFLSIKTIFHREIELIHFEYSKSPIYNHEFQDNRTLFKVLLKFQNMAKEVLYKKDVYKNIMITNQHTHQSLKTIEFKSTCAFLSIYGKIEDNKLEFFPNFWESKKQIEVSFEIYSQNPFVEKFSDEELLIEVKSKIIGGNHFVTHINYRELFDFNYYSGKKVAERTYLMIFIALGLFYCHILFLEGLFNKSNIELWNTLTAFNKDSPLIIMFLVIAALISAGFGYNLRKFFYPYGVLAKKEKTWFAKSFNGEPTDAIDFYGLNK